MVGVNLSDVKVVFGCMLYVVWLCMLGCDWVGIVCSGFDNWIGVLVWGLGGDFGVGCDGLYVEWFVLDVVYVCCKLGVLMFDEVVGVGVLFVIVYEGLC